MLEAESREFIMKKKAVEEKVRINRVLMIDEAIRFGSYPSIAKLAEKAEVNERTIERDIEYLRNMYEAPIEYDRTRRGYYYSKQNFFIKSIIKAAIREQQPLLFKFQMVHSGFMHGRPNGNHQPGVLVMNIFHHCRRIGETLRVK